MSPILKLESEGRTGREIYHEPQTLSTLHALSILIVISVSEEGKLRIGKAIYSLPQRCSI